jgi:hypothetical protein
MAGLSDPASGSPDRLRPLASDTVVIEAYPVPDQPLGRRKPGRPPSTPPLHISRPDLAAEWHPTRNGELKPDTISSGSNRRVWWICGNGPDHEWEAQPANRIGLGTGCPFCAGKRASITNSLAALRPDLAAEWDSARNADSPENVVTGSNKTYWWICAADQLHQWRAQVAKRAKRGDGCPYCGGRRVTPETSLAGQEPELAAEWHPTRNLPLTPDRVTTGSSTRVWWRCSRDNVHEWQTAIAERARAHRTGCPYCTGRMVTATNSLAAKHPELAAQWHPTRNVELTPDHVAAGSERMVWWLCPTATDHEWQAQPAARRHSPACPFCSGRLPSSTSSLAARNPTLAAEWHPRLNGNTTANDVTWRSQRKVWWRCPRDPSHEWEAVIRNRAVLGNGCPYCSGFCASPLHSLKVKHPTVAEFWHPTNNGNLSPADVPPAAKRKVWWQCRAGPDHEWRAPVYVAAAARDRAGCPFCACRRLSVTNRLSITHPHVAAEWHPTRNGDLTANDVVFGTPRTVWWCCPANPLHEWRAKVVARTRIRNGTNCPYCTLVPRSLQEIMLAFELREFIVYDIDDHKITLGEGENRTILDVDILVRRLRLVIEFDGSHWHRNKVEVDQRKADVLRRHGWRVIRVRETPLRVLHADDLEVPSVSYEPKAAANLLLQKIASTCDVSMDLTEYLRVDQLRAEAKARRYALRLAAKRQPALENTTTTP